MLLATFILANCTSIKGNKIDINNISDPVNTGNLNLSYEIREDYPEENYKVIVKSSYQSGEEKLIPIVDVRQISNEGYQEAENRVKEYSKYYGNHFLNQFLFRQNTLYKTDHNGVNFSKIYKTPSFGRYTYKLSLDAYVKYFMQENKIRESSFTSNKGCKIKIFSKYKGGVGSFSCQFSEIITTFTFFLVPHYCHVGYELSASLVDNNSNQTLKEYSYEESANRIVWSLLPLAGKSKSLDDINKADDIAQEKISRSLISDITNDAVTFLECQK